MPIETAQYINTLQPDWPEGLDPESGGDDHLRMVKQVLQNTFPQMAGPVEASHTQLTDIAQHLVYYPGDGTEASPEQLYAYNNNPDAWGYIPIAAATPSLASYQANNGLVLTYATLASLLYPVGSVVMNTGANPADAMGFGTWVTRSGTIYGVGDAADQNGYNKNFTLGAHNVDAFWRIQNGHIVSTQLSVAVTVSDDSGHQHGVPLGGNNSGGSNGITASADAGIPNQELTTIGGAHGHAASGSTTIGSGSMIDGAQYVQPGYAFYVWERTA